MWSATTHQILALRERLIAEQVTLVVIEATSDCWTALDPFHSYAAALRTQLPAATRVLDAFTRSNSG